MLNHCLLWNENHSHHHNIACPFYCFFVKQLANPQTKNPTNLKKGGRGVIFCTSGNETSNESNHINMRSFTFPSYCCWKIIFHLPIPVSVYLKWLKIRPFRYKTKWQLLIVDKLITLQLMSFCIKQGALCFPYSDGLAQHSTAIYIDVRRPFISWSLTNRSLSNRPCSFSLHCVWIKQRWIFPITKSSCAARKQKPITLEWFFKRTVYSKGNIIRLSYHISCEASFENR